MLKTENGQELKFFVHKYEVQQCYGGPEEGGWWYDKGYPAEDWVSVGFETEDGAYEYCRTLNEQEHERRESLQYGYTSVLSYREDFFDFAVSDEPVAKPFPETRPHYE